MFWDSLTGWILTSLMKPFSVVDWLVCLIFLESSLVIDFVNSHLLTDDLLTLDCTQRWLAFCLLCICGDTALPVLMLCICVCVFLGYLFRGSSLLFCLFKELFSFLLYHFCQVFSLRVTNFCFCFIHPPIFLIQQLAWLLGLIPAFLRCEEGCSSCGLSTAESHGALRSVVS